MDDNERSGYVLLAKNDADDANESINRLDKDDTDEQVRRSMHVASTLALVSIARSLVVVADQGEILIHQEPQSTPTEVIIHDVMERARRRHVTHPEFGGDSVDAAIGSALIEVEEALLRRLRFSLYGTLPAPETDTVRTLSADTGSEGTSDTVRTP
jgi:hypothetical protein